MRVLVDVCPYGGADEQLIVGLHLGDPITLLVMADGKWRIAHTCDRTAKDRGVIRCAPELHADHRIHRDGLVTIAPSILCPDCGLHGYVRDSQWVSA